MAPLYFVAALLAAVAIIFAFVVHRVKTEPLRQAEKKNRNMIAHELNLEKIADWRKNFNKKYYADLEKAAQRAFDREFALIEYIDFDKLVQLHLKAKDYPGINDRKAKVTKEIRDAIENRLSKLEAKAFTYPEKMTTDEGAEILRFEDVTGKAEITEFDERIRKAKEILASKDKLPKTVRESISRTLQETK